MVATIQPRLSSSSICATSPAVTRITARQSSSQPRSWAMWPKNASRSSDTPTAISPIAIKDGNNLGPAAAWLGPTSSSAVWAAMNRPSASTPRLSTPSPTRRLRPLVIDDPFCFALKAAMVAMPVAAVANSPVPRRARNRGVSW